MRYQIIQNHLHLFQRVVEYFGIVLLFKEPVNENMDKTVRPQNTGARNRRYEYLLAQQMGYGNIELVLKSLGVKTGLLCLDRILTEII